MKFLNKFRKKSLSENKFNRYVIYAIGEILLVVIGILIAVYINKNQEEKKNRMLQRDFARQLKSSFTKTKEEMGYIYSWSKKIYVSQEKIIRYLNTPDQEDKPSSKDWSMYFKVSIPILPNASYESLKTFGLHHILNDSLRAQLIELYDNKYANFKEATTHYNEQLVGILEDSGPYLTDWSWSWNKFSTEVRQMDKLLSDNSYIFRLKVLKEANLYNIIILEEILQDINTIILGLEKELQATD